MAEYGSMFLVSGLATILFFGGWHGPIPIFYATGMAYSVNALDFETVGFLANVFGCANFILKAVIGVVVMMWVRWTFPRLRIDQVITTCLKYCVPLASIGFVGVLVWQAYGIPFINDIAPANYPGQVREAWVLEANRPVVLEAETEEPAAEVEEPEHKTASHGHDNTVALTATAENMNLQVTKGAR